MTKDPEDQFLYRAKAWFHRVVFWRYWIIICGLRNIRTFWSAVWNFDTCDWTGAAELMEISFREIAKHHRECKTVADWERTAMQAAVASQLCRRLIDDNYAQMHGYDHEGYCTMSDQDRKIMYARARASRKSDKKHLGLLLSKYFDYWWD